MKDLFAFLLLFCITATAFAQLPDSTKRNTTDTNTVAKRDTTLPVATNADSVQKDAPVPAPPPQKDTLAVSAPKSAPQTDSLQKAKTDTILPKWKLSNMARLNFAQTGFVNWSAGGENSVATNAFFTTSANYKNGSWAWDTKLDTEFGLVYTSRKKPEAGKWDKSADKIHLSTTFGYTYNDRLYYSFLGEFKTQYARSHFNDKYISTFMAPGYLNLGLGVDYKEPKTFSLLGMPVKDFTTFFSLFVARFSFVLDEKLSQAGAFGVKPGERVKKQVGMGAKTAFKINPVENVFISTTLNLFTPYVDKFFNFVVDWDTVVNMKINKYLSASLHMALKYDEKIHDMDKNNNPQGPRVQLKEMLGVGVVYSFK
jgi:hypothetical protein